MGDLSELGKAALSYAIERGWFVFPIVPRRKKPAIIKDYYTLSSRDPEQIKAWWTATPDANIGLDCGKSGLIAIDADSEAGHGKDHAGVGAPLAGLMLLSGGKHAWETLISKTPSGGEHYVFLALSETDGIIKSNSNNFGVPGIDVRAKGGYIVLPPSYREKDEGITGHYSWANDAPILPLPRKLLSSPGSRDELGRTQIEAVLQDGERIGKGRRDTFLIQFAGKLRHLGLNYGELRAVIKASYEERCDPSDDPFTEEDFDRLTKSAMKWTDDLKVPAKLQQAITSEPTGHWNSTDETYAVPASDFMVHYTAPTNWIVDQIFQSYSLNQSVGSPKAGKSTLLRHLALCAAYGLDFLGRWKTQKVPVLYYTLQENKPHLRKWLLGALWGQGLCEVGEIPLDVPIDFVFRIGHRGEKAIQGTLERVKERGYGLVIVDMLGRYAGVESFDDYAENEAVTDALHQVAQDTGACILWAHHERKSGGGPDGFSGGIGSQSIRGAVYTTIKHWKERGRYYVSTEQRDGDDIAATAITLDPKTFTLKAVGSHLSMAISDEILREQKIRDLLEHDPNMPVRLVVDQTGGRLRDVQKMIDRLKKEMEDKKDETA